MDALKLPGEPSAGASPEGWRKVARETDVTSHRPCGANVGGVELVLVRGPQGVRAFQGQCPHQGTLLSEGEVSGGQLVCRAHGWRFDVATGERSGGARVCLASHPVKTEAGDVLVRLDGKQSALGPRDRSEKPLLSLTAPAKRSLDDLPGPRGWPVVGNAFQLDIDRLHEQLEGWARELGSLYRLRLMSHRVLVVSDPDLTELLLRARPGSLRRTGTLERVFAEMGTAGVFSAEGNSWRAQRRLAMYALSNRNLKSSFATLRRVAERLDRHWAEASRSGEALDIDADLMRFTVDVTTSLVFSTDMDTLGKGGDQLQRHLSLVFPAFTRRILAPFPYWRVFRLPSDRKLDRALGAVRKLQQELVAEKRAALAQRADDDEPRDFLEAMLTARDEQGKPFGDEIVYGNMMTMLLAGEDTTAHTLAWAVHYLCERPDVVALMRDEVDAALGDRRTPFDFEGAQTFPYLDAVASETMRLKPVAPFLAFEALEDLVVGDVAVPKGTWIDTLVRLPSLSAENFAQPEVFEPERWLQSNSGTHVANASIPFGSGPRICPGRTLALLEMRVVLATLVKNFDVERVGPAGAVREHFAFTMAPRGLRIRLRERGSVKQLAAPARA